MPNYPFVRLLKAGLGFMLLTFACSPQDRRDQYFGMDAGDSYATPDGGFWFDTRTAIDVVPPMGDGQTGLSTEGAVAGANDFPCKTCELENIASGTCVEGAGCDGLSGIDKNLCLALVACIRSTGCWKKAASDCLCGTATGVACASAAANGACRQEIQAATKTLDFLKNGLLLNSLSVPAGHATQLIACDKTACVAACGLGN